MAGEAPDSGLIKTSQPAAVNLRHTEIHVHRSTIFEKEYLEGIIVDLSKHTVTSASLNDMPATQNT